MCVHILGGHKGSINCVSIHPSGKLAVSVAQDNTLKVWNLVQGRIAFTRRLKGSANLVKWLKPSGAAYMLVVGKKVEVSLLSWLFNSECYAY
jgi:WD40 repeat protein